MARIEASHDLAFKDGSRYMVNVESVGQPRDEIVLACCYLRLDTILRTVAWRRVAYDISTTQQKIWTAYLPERNADRLASMYYRKPRLGLAWFGSARAIIRYAPEVPIVRNLRKVRPHM